MGAKFPFGPRVEGKRRGQRGGDDWRWRRGKRRRRKVKRKEGRKGGREEVEGMRGFSRKEMETGVEKMKE